MERAVAKFTSHEEAAKADALYYRQLTPQRRLEILLELIEQAHPDLHASGQGLQRVYRVLKLELR